MNEVDSKIKDLKDLLSNSKRIEVQEKENSNVKQLYDFGVRFRNYNPRSKILQVLRLKKLKKVEAEKMIDNVILTMEKRKNEEPNVIPSKANWDLKRIIEDDLKELEKRTMKSIAETLEEKMDLEDEMDSDDDEDEDDEEDYE